MSFSHSLVNNKCIEKYAGWLSSDPCDCPSRFWSTVEIAWQEVPMWHPISENATRSVLGLMVSCKSSTAEQAKSLDPVHETVNVTYKCVNCAKQFHRIYELVSNNNGTKRKLNGHYENVYKTKERSQVHRSFGFVEEQYFEMGHAYDMFHYNCKHWAAEFYGKIVTGSGVDGQLPNELGTGQLSANRFGSG